MSKLALKLILFFQLIFLTHFIAKIGATGSFLVDNSHYQDINVFRSNTTNEISHQPVTDLHLKDPGSNKLELDDHELESDFQLKDPGSNKLELDDHELESDDIDTLLGDDDDDINAAQRLNRRSINLARRRCRRTCTVFVVLEDVSRGRVEVEGEGVQENNWKDSIIFLDGRLRDEAK
ncbi:9618_t:CDS:2 [Ambispora gerdemannii]|uniref:9618_t:CDS:1 n=1 Tax=Ambispora gerdemannii TaxID=144530 RepID=A0A9N9GUD0_9GLOM|nr:9618_t:CDS:2 [Ambispora gerdemannii]